MESLYGKGLPKKLNKGRLRRQFSKRFMSSGYVAELMYDFVYNYIQKDRMRTLKERKSSLLERKLTLREPNWTLRERKPGLLERKLVLRERILTLREPMPGLLESNLVLKESINVPKDSKAAL
jgi:hypothetical protein